MNDFYIYIYLDQCKTGIWKYKDLIFNYQPFYVGKGKNNRINHHLQPKSLSNNSIKSNKINNIIRELDEQPIHYRIFEKLSFEEANKLEINIIKTFGRIDLGTGFLTNMTDGGEGFKNVVFTAETKKKMSEKAKGTKTYANNGMSKIVEKYSLDNVLIETYRSLREAAESIGKDFKNISSCCRGKSKTAYNFIWKYAGKSYNPIIKPETKNRKKKVYQYNLNGNFIKEWESVSSATNAGFKHISAACSGKLNFVGGYQWRYEKFDKIEKLTFEKTNNIRRYEKISN